MVALTRVEQDFLPGNVILDPSYVFRGSEYGHLDVDCYQPFHLHCKFRTMREQKYAGRESSLSCQTAMNTHIFVPAISKDVSFSVIDFRERAVYLGI